MSVKYGQWNTFWSGDVGGLGEGLINGTLVHTSALPLNDSSKSVQLEAFSSGSAYTAAFASPVPVPAAAWLFGSGLIGLVGVGRRQSI